MTTTKTTILLRRDTAANWTSVHPILHAGEIGFETDTGKFKIGDGTTLWTGLGYFTGDLSALTTASVPDSANKRYITDAQLAALANSTNSNSGDVTLAGENYVTLLGQVITANAVDLSGTNATGALAAGRFPALTGAITTVEGSLETALTANIVDNAALAQMATLTIKGNNTGSTADALDLTASQVKALLAIANTDVSGLGTISTQDADAVSLTGNMAMGANKITGLADGTADTDAATVGQITSLSGGLGTMSTQNANAVSLTGNMAMGANKITGLANGTVSTDAATFGQMTSMAIGLDPVDPIATTNVITDNIDAPPGSPTIGDAYLVPGGLVAGEWFGKAGHIMEYNGTSWVSVLGRAVVTGDRFGVDFENTIAASGSLFAMDRNIAQVVVATPGSLTFAFTAPVNTMTVAVNGTYSHDVGHLYYFNGTSSEWVDFGLGFTPQAGNGIVIDGLTLSVDTAVVATLANAQTLTNKDLTSGTNTFPTFNQSTTGNAATVTTNANLTGDVTSTGNATTIGAGKVTEAMQVLADNTTQDVSITKHGYAPKAPNDATKFLDGTGAYSSPPSGVTTLDGLTDVYTNYTSHNMLLNNTNAASGYYCTDNTFLGDFSGFAGGSGALCTNNTMVGTYAGSSTGATAATGDNSGFGRYVLKNMDGASYNSAVGSSAFVNLVGGNYNAGFGHSVGLAIINGNYNTLFGDTANVTGATAVNQIAIGYNATAPADNTAQIGNTAVTDVYFGDGTAVLHGVVDGGGA